MPNQLNQPISIIHQLTIQIINQYLELSVHLFYIITGIVCLLFLLGFAVTSYIEKEKRASAISLIIAAVYGVAWFMAGHIYPAGSLQIAIVFWLLLMAGFGLLFWPFGAPAALRFRPSSTERCDERHVIFGQMETCYKF
jgi:hypothetical protein